MTRTASGRASPGEYPSYAEDDIAFVAGDDIARALAEQGERALSRLSALDEGQIRGLRYAPGKWTLKEVIGHLADDERIFMYRLLCVLRNDRRVLDGFDEKEYVAAARFEAGGDVGLANARPICSTSIARFERQRSRSSGG